MARTARAETSDRVKEWEKQRRHDEEARQAAREDTSDVGDRLREVYRAKSVSFRAVLPGAAVDGGDRTVACGPLMAQQAATLRRVFEADGYTIL